MQEWGEPQEWGLAGVGGPQESGSESELSSCRARTAGPRARWAGTGAPGAPKRRGAGAEQVHGGWTVGVGPILGTPKPVRGGGQAHARSFLDLKSSQCDPLATLIRAWACVQLPAP